MSNGTLICIHPEHRTHKNTNCKCGLMNAHKWETTKDDYDNLKSVECTKRGGAKGCGKTGYVHRYDETKLYENNAIEIIDDYKAIDLNFFNGVSEDIKVSDLVTVKNPDVKEATGDNFDDIFNEVSTSSFDKKDTERTRFFGNAEIDRKETEKTRSKFIAGSFVKLIHNQFIKLAEKFFGFPLDIDKETRKDLDELGKGAMEYLNLSVNPVSQYFVMWGAILLPALIKKFLFSPKSDKQKEMEKGIFKE